MMFQSSRCISQTIFYRTQIDVCRIHRWNRPQPLDDAGAVALLTLMKIRWYDSHPPPFYGHPKFLSPASPPPNQTGDQIPTPHLNASWIYRFTS